MLACCDRARTSHSWKMLIVLLLFCQFVSLGPACVPAGTTDEPPVVVHRWVGRHHQSTISGLDFADALIDRGPWTLYCIPWTLYAELQQGSVWWPGLRTSVDWRTIRLPRLHGYPPPQALDAHISHTYDHPCIRSAPETGNMDTPHAYT